MYVESVPLRSWIPKHTQPSWPPTHTAAHRQSPPAPSTFPSNDI